MFYTVFLGLAPQALCSRLLRRPSGQINQPLCERCLVVVGQRGSDPAFLDDPVFKIHLHWNAVDSHRGYKYPTVVVKNSKRKRLLDRLRRIGTPAKRYDAEVANIFSPV